MSTVLVFIRLIALEWALIRGWALIKFSPFSVSVACLLCNKTINGNKKTNEGVTKQGFCKIL